MEADAPKDAKQVITGLLAERDPGKTICPSEAARVLGGDDGFRPFMEPVRAAARELIRDGQIDATQHGEVVDLDSAKGPIRLRSRH